MAYIPPAEYERLAKRVFAIDAEGHLQVDIADHVHGFAYVIYKKDATYYARASPETGYSNYSGTDAATVIQSALNALMPARTWKERVILKGDFLLESIPAGNVAACIEPKSYTVIQVDAKLKLAAGVNAHVIDIKGASDVEICGGEIDGNGANQTADVHCIRGESVTRVNIHDMYIHDGRYYNVGFEAGTMKDVFLNRLVLANPNQRDNIDFKDPNANNQGIVLSDIVTYGMGATVGSRSIDVRGKNTKMCNIQVYGVGGSGNRGITLRSGSEGSSLAGFRVEGVDGNEVGVGVECASDRVMVGEGEVREAVVGVEVLAAECTVKARARSCTSYGVRFNGVFAGGLFNGICEGNGSDGVRVTDATDVVIKGRSTGNGGYGVRSTGAADYLLLDCLNLRGNALGPYTLVGVNNVIGDLVT